MTSDVEYADENETGQLGLGVPGEQRAIPTLAAPVEAETVPMKDPGVTCFVIFPGQTEIGPSSSQNTDPEQVREMFKGFGWGVTE